MFVFVVMVFFGLCTPSAEALSFSKITREDQVLQFCEIIARGLSCI